MRNSLRFLLLSLVPLAFSSSGEVRTVFERNDNERATPAFKFQHVPSPSRNDAGERAKFTLITGRRDGNGGGLEVLNDGRMPQGEDDPAENFFFAQGTDGGRLVVDLGSVTQIQQVNTYSWHHDTRGPQVYRLFASDGRAPDFKPRSDQDIEPEKCGWKLLSRVDTRPKQGEPGGQYGVSISDSEGSLGSFRYLLFEISRTEDQDPFGNTFYSEIDILNARGAEPIAAQAPTNCRETIEAEGGYQLKVDTCDAPDLAEWVHTNLVPMARAWYPKLVKLLPSADFEAPQTVTITFSQAMQGVAVTGGTRVRCAARWFRANLKGEAVGAILHELVHVVQQYGTARREHPDATRPPGWLVEGIADYVRWFRYEPQSHGAEITRRNLARARYDANYRITANFLNWVTEKYDPELVPQLNAAIREGRYSPSLWQQRTGHTAQELGDEWKAAMEKKSPRKQPTPAAQTLLQLDCLGANRRTFTSWCRSSASRHQRVSRLMVPTNRSTNILVRSDARISAAFASCCGQECPRSAPLEARCLYKFAERIRTLLSERRQRPCYRTRCRVMDLDCFDKSGN